MKKKLTTIALFLILLAGFGLLLYPAVSDFLNSYYQSRSIADYTERVAEMDEADYEAMWNQAGEYNRKLAREAGNRYIMTEAEEKEYDSLLDVTGTGIMGYVEIPKLNTSLPIYHGTDGAVLQIAIGHLAGSSLPVGGADTHCVLTGHRGLPSARLFTGLDQMAEGDLFFLHVLDRTLTYEVDQIRIVEPREMEDLEIEEGKDYCTLVTCTPYGVNSHRLLVRGHRITNPEDEILVPADAVQIDRLLAAPVMAGIAGVFLAVYFLLRRKFSAGNLRKMHQNSQEKKEERRGQSGTHPGRKERQSDGYLKRRQRRSEKHPGRRRKQPGKYLRRRQRKRRKRLSRRHGRKAGMYEK